MSARDQGFQFMLEEYKRIHSLIVFIDQQGENRSRFFLTISSTSIGAIAVLSQISNIPSEYLILCFEILVLILIIFGLNTLSRLAARSNRIKTYKILISKLQEYFSKYDPEVSYYIKLQQTKQKGFSQKKKKRFSMYPFEGTLSELMIMLISLLVSGIVFEKMLQAKILLVIIIFSSIATVITCIIILKFYYEFLKEIRPPEM